MRCVGLLATQRAASGCCWLRAPTRLPIIPSGDLPFHSPQPSPCSCDAVPRRCKNNSHSYMPADAHSITHESLHHKMMLYISHFSNMCAGYKLPCCCESEALQACLALKAGNLKQDPASNAVRYSLSANLVDKVSQGHGGGIQGELQLGCTTHHALLVGLTGREGLHQEPAPHWPLHQEACLHVQWS